MIAEFRIKNFMSIGSELTLSFIASKDTDIEDIYTREMIDGTRLLKLCVIMGANQSGKSNMIKALDFFRHLMTEAPADGQSKLGRVPFHFREQPNTYPSFMEMTFYLEGKKYIETVEFNDSTIIKEELRFYGSTRPTSLYKRTYKDYNNEFTVSFSDYTGLTQKILTVIKGNTTNNCTVMASLCKSHVTKGIFHKVCDFFQNSYADIVTSEDNLRELVHDFVQEDKDGMRMKFLLEMLKNGDADINGIAFSNTAEGKKLSFKHLVNGKIYELPEKYESDGLKRLLGMAALLYRLFQKSDLLMIDVLETELHPEWRKLLINTFLKNTTNTSQILLTSHAFHLLDEDYIRRDMIWLTDKNANSETSLERLNGKGLHKSLSAYNAYRNNKLVKVPSIGNPVFKVGEE